MHGAGPFSALFWRRRLGDHSPRLAALCIYSLCISGLRKSFSTSTPALLTSQGQWGGQWGGIHTSSAHSQARASLILSGRVFMQLTIFIAVSRICLNFGSSVLLARDSLWIIQSVKFTCGATCKTLTFSPFFSPASLQSCPHTHQYSFPG